MIGLNGYSMVTVTDLGIQTHYDRDIYITRIDADNHSIYVEVAAVSLQGLPSDVATRVRNGAAIRYINALLPEDLKAEALQHFE